MKKNKTALSVIILSGILLLLLSGCYELATQQDGALALNTSVSGRKLLVDEGDAGDNDLWVVGFVIEASSEESLKELLELNDRHDYGADNYDEIQDIYMDLAMGGALRFDGGRPFFQFEMPRIDAESGTVTGNFSVQGIPADREYFLHLIVIDDAISTLNDLEEKPLAQGGTHYFDADSYGSYTVTSSETADSWSNGGTELESGWYMFNAWVPTYADDNAETGAITNITAEVVTDSEGNPQGDQPFFVEPGKTVKLNLSLVETPDLP